MARGWTAAMSMALLGVAAGRSTLPLRVPATGAEVLALPPALLERLWAQENGVAMIVGGEEVDPPFKYPWQADIFFKTSGHLCGGSLFNETWILTAARACACRPGARGTAAAAAADARGARATAVVQARRTRARLHDCHHPA